MDSHPVFAADDRGGIAGFFSEHDYAVVGDALAADEVAFLNDFVDRSKARIPAEWGVGQGVLHTHGQILVEHPELDRFARHPAVLPLVEDILGPETRFAQIDFRDVPVGVGEKAALRFHRDRGFVPEEFWVRQQACAYVCAVYYLSDVGPDDTCFCVVPGSQDCESIEEARERLGNACREIPVRGPAGTAVLYDISIHHTRLLGANDAGRRTMHHYFSREGNPPLTNWALVPERLARHADAPVRAYYSQWTEAMRDYAAAGFSDEFYRNRPR